MGMFDEVTIKCPKCGEENIEQSKAGECLLIPYTVDSCPDEVFEDIILNCPISCLKCKYDITARDIIISMYPRLRIFSFDIWAAVY